jgi:tetratricopeptide (TPR) repeat protein
VGEFDEALGWAREGIEIASKVTSAMSTVWVTDYLALTHLRRGEFEQAIALAEPNFELCERAEVLLLRTITSGILGLAFSAAGRHGDAIRLLQLAVKPEILHHHPEGSGYPFVWLAEAYLRAARLSEAREAAARALAIARKQEEHAHEAWARFTQAEIERASRSPVSKVTSAYEVALDGAERGAMRPLAALCQLGLALTDVEIGGAKTVSQSLIDARESFRTMGMQFWLDQANRLSG